ncbi:PHP domain-containing protein [Haloechinothrix sp. LS1_15]|uniref:PHP domain-containing protein n=1 Tax=Haloechinothrix sp. LS1_15 TaxID=2652248 RepID=UPI0029442519|nr:PHP domain-containing protein [Haloechinothrix sp. LS1_15]MDV6013877.1 PHP domain-containing protein [Haloechinothrix sp. LS1_15]
MTHSDLRIDLHAHSTCSDGTDTPSELLHAAAAAGLDVVALTDHDTTAGWEAARASVPAGLTLVPGMEWSCAWHHRTGRAVSVHLLAYLFDPSADAMLAEQRRLRTERRRRLHTMAARMTDDGLPVDPERLLTQLDADLPVGRPHLARVLVDAGVATSIDDAFARYLTSSRRYYVPREDTPVEQAIEMVAAAGGVSVLAHPFAYRRGPTIDADAITGLAALGLTGIEVDHPDHDGEARQELRALAAKHDLLVTGSSDYHGANKPIPIGAETTDPAVLAELCSLARGSTVSMGEGRR